MRVKFHAQYVFNLKRELPERNDLMSVLVNEFREISSWDSNKYYYLPFKKMNILSVFKLSNVSIAYLPSYSGSRARKENNSK